MNMWDGKDSSGSRDGKADSSSFLAVLLSLVSIKDRLFSRNTTIVKTNNEEDRITEHLAPVGAECK